MHGLKSKTLFLKFLKILIIYICTPLKWHKQSQVSSGKTCSIFHWVLSLNWLLELLDSSRLFVCSRDYLHIRAKIASGVYIISGKRKILTTGSWRKTLGAIGSRDTFILETKFQIKLSVRMWVRSLNSKTRDDAGSVWYRLTVTRFTSNKLG